LCRVKGLNDENEQEFEYDLWNVDYQLVYRWSALCGWLKGTHLTQEALAQLYRYLEKFMVDK